jgi:peptidylprolyl isomerase
MRIFIGLKLSALLATTLFMSACSKSEVVAPAVTAGQNPAVTAAAMKKTASGLQYEDLVAGSGNTPSPGKQVTVHYTGWLTNGTKFDSSLDSNQPFTFTIGKGEVVPGWDEGVMSMKIGGKRKLVIPPELGYGAAGAGGVIPPNATLIFEVILLDVR